MAIDTFKSRVLIDEHDISADLNQVQLTYGADPVERTNLTDTVHAFLPGVKNVDALLTGYHQAGTPPDEIDDILNALVGLSTVSLIAITVGVPAEGSTGYAFNGRLADFTILDAAHGAIPTTVAHMVHDESTNGRELTRGTVLVTGAKTSTGQSAEQAIGALSATQAMYVGLWGQAVTTSLDVIVQYDTTGFPSPTAGFTFTQLTAPGFQGMEKISGAVSETFWRTDYTLSGNATFLVIAGIGDI